MHLVLLFDRTLLGPEHWTRVHLVGARARAAWRTARGRDTAIRVRAGGEAIRELHGRERASALRASSYTRSPHQRPDARDGARCAHPLAVSRAEPEHPYGGRHRGLPPHRVRIQ